MMTDPAKESFEKMTGIVRRLTGDAAVDFELVGIIRKELEDKSDLWGSDRAYLSLTYMHLYHPSALVRHEAAFVVGESTPQSTFLDYSALHDPNPVVRHEACLAMGHPSNRKASVYRWVLRYISEHDTDEMVRDSARVALKRIS